MAGELERAQEDLQSAERKLQSLSAGEIGRDGEDYRASAARHVARLEYTLALGRVLALRVRGHTHGTYD